MTNDRQAAPPSLPTKVTFAFCTFNRAERLDRLVTAMRAQRCPVPFRILAVNNNSQDDTPAVLARLAARDGPRLVWVTETEQGIVPARNRAIDESLESEILVFIDDDEMPLPGLLEAAWDAIAEEGADCVGGPIGIDYEGHGRPSWLDDELAGFLGALDYGREPFWIADESRPIWNGNVAYRMARFRDDPALRFDKRYNRAGAGIGGGEDRIMFQNYVTRGYRLRYRPDMSIAHHIEPWKLRRSYFLRLHYRAGLRHGLHRLPEYGRTVLGIPPFLVRTFLQQTGVAARNFVLGRRYLRDAMNASHTAGSIVGYSERTKRRE